MSMSLLLRRPVQAFALVGAAVLALLFATLTPAHAGAISCGNGQWSVFNRTSPSSQIHIWHPGLCQPYSDILTVSGDTVNLDYTGGGYIVLSPRTACDWSPQPTGTRFTWRNSSYTSNAYIWPEDYGYTYRTYLWLCTNY